MKKLLPMKYPNITTFSDEADILSAISYDSSTLPWIYGNLIQLCTPKYNDQAIFYYRPRNINPFLYCPENTARSNIELNWSSITEFLIESINKNYYSYFNVDRFYLPGDCYYKRHVVHATFVFGYDTASKCFHIADHLNSGKYEYLTCKFKDFQSAYLHGVDDEFFNGIIRMKKINSDYTFDLDITIKLLTDYVMSNNCKFKTNFFLQDDNLIFGMGIYEKLISYIDNLPSKKDNRIDPRPFQQLWEHKKCMIQRLNYMIEYFYFENSILNYFIEIEKKFLVLRNLVLRYNLTKRGDILKTINLELKNISKNESKYIELLIENLQQQAKLTVW